MKHLNPRQGITTVLFPPFFRVGVRERVKHLNPRQGITTYAVPQRFRDAFDRVKHLNPRQGITTWLLRLLRSAPVL